MSCNIIYLFEGHTSFILFFFFQAEDGIRDVAVTGVQTCALPICGIGKGLRHGLAGHAASETELRVMSGVVAFGAVAGRLAAAAHDRGKGAGSQITQTEELLQELGSFGLQSIDIVRHKVSFLYPRLSVRI